MRPEQTNKLSKVRPLTSERVRPGDDKLALTLCRNPASENVDVF